MTPERNYHIILGDGLHAVELRAHLTTPMHPLAGLREGHLSALAHEQVLLVGCARRVALVLLRACVSCGRRPEIALRAVYVRDAAERAAALVQELPVGVLALDHRLAIARALRLTLVQARLADRVLRVRAAARASDRHAADRALARQGLPHVVHADDARGLVDALDVPLLLAGPAGLRLLAPGREHGEGQRDEGEHGGVAELGGGHLASLSDSGRAGRRMDTSRAGPRGVDLAPPI